MYRNMYVLHIVVCMCVCICMLVCVCMYVRINFRAMHVASDGFFLRFKDSALQWVLRADVERTSLLDDEARLLLYLHHGDGSDGNGNGTSDSCSGSSGGGSRTSIVKGKEEKAESTRCCMFQWNLVCVCMYGEDNSVPKFQVYL